MSKAQQEYINRNDLEGAYKRYDTARANWKEHWWSVVVEIWNKCKDWAKKFALDLENHKLVKLVKRGRPAKVANIEYACEAEGCGAYIVQHFDSKGRILWTKVGKADNVRKRLAEHLKSDYKGEAFSAICLHFFPAKNKNHALSVENVLRDHFEAKGCRLLGNDRFPTVHEVTAEDLKAISERLYFTNKSFGA